MANEKGHFVRFLQRVKTASLDLGARTYLYLDSGFSIYDRPDDDAIGIQFNPAGLYQTPWKFQVEGRATSNVNIESPSTIGGVALVDEVRYGLFGQSDPKQNGIYYYDSDSNTLIRTSDADENTDILGAVVMCRKGTGAGEMWYCSNTGTAIPGSDNITFALRQASGDKAKLDGIAVGAQAVTWPNIVTAGATAALDLDLNGIEVTGAADPTTAQSLVTRQYYEDNLPSGGVSDVVGTSPITVTGTTTKTVAISAGSVCTWPNIVTAGATAAADLAINGRSITSCIAVTSAGALALTAASGAATVDASASVNLGTTNATAVNIGHGTITTTINGTTDSVLAGIAAVKTTGTARRNTTAAVSVGATVQLAPSDVDEGHVWTTSDKTMRRRRTLVPRTSGNLDIITEYDTGSGSYSEAYRYTTLSSSSFRAAFQCYAFLCGSGGVSQDSSGSGMFYGGSGALQMKSYDSGNPLLMHSDEGVTWEMAAAKIWRRNWGTVGVNYINEAPKVLTTTDATVTNAITLAMADNSAGMWEVEVYCYIIGSAANRAYFKYKAGFNRDGGAPVRDYSINDLGTDQVVGGWGTPPTVAVTAGAPTTNDVSVQVTGLVGSNIKWTVHARYHVTTTSA